MLLVMNRVVYECNALNGHAVVKAFEVSLWKKKREVGCIQIQQTNDYCQINFFCVRKEYWKQKIGFNLLENAIEALCGEETEPIRYIRVFPNPESLYGEDAMPIETLYSRYRALGFKPIKEDFDPTIPNQQHRKYL